MPNQISIITENLPSLEQMIMRILTQNKIVAVKFAFYEPWMDTASLQMLHACDDDNPYNLVAQEPFGVLEKDTSEISINYLSNLVKAYLNDAAIGIQSDVQIKNDEDMQIFMLDFKCPKSNENLQRVGNIIADGLGVDSGYIVDSGNSYHFWGSNIIEDEEWQHKIAESSRYPEIGVHWPSFQLNRGFTILRISACADKPHVPRVIAELKSPQLKLFKEKA